MAKIAGIEMCSAYNRQYGTRFLAVMPTNLYRDSDNYDLNASHVLPALIRKMTEARQECSKTVTIWGTGKPRREFMLSDDMADACLFLMGLSSDQFEDLAVRGEAEFETLEEQDIVRRTALWAALLKKGDVDSLALLANIDRRLGLLVEAREDFQVALDKSPNDPALVKAVSEIDAQLGSD